MQSKGKITLLENAGVGNGASKIWPGGKGSFAVEATFGGSNVKLQMKAPNDTFVDVASSTLSANGSLNIELPPGEIRAVSTTAIAVYAAVTHIGT